MAVEAGPGARAPRRHDAAALPRAGRGRARRGAARRLAETEVRLKEARQTLERARSARDATASPARPTSTRAEAEVDALEARLDADPRAGDGGRAAGGAAPDRPRRHGHPRAVLRRRDLEGRAARRDGLAGLGRRRVHAHRHLHDRRHVVARDRSGRQRELHQPRHARPEVEATLDAYPDWRIPGARHHDRARRRIARRRRCWCASGSRSSTRGSCPTWA